MPHRAFVATILAAAAILAATAGCRQTPTDYAAAQAETERRVAERFLDDIAYHAGEQTAQRIADMPFLETPQEGADLPALAAMAAIAKRDSRDLAVLMERDITDEASWRVVPQRRLLPDYELAHSILDPEEWRLSVRQTVMPDGDVATVGILWPVTSNYRPNHEIIAKALRVGWELNGSLPVPGLDLPVILGLKLREGTQARLHANQIEISPQYSHDTPAGRWVLAHEVAHLWWHNHDHPTGWIDEGMAELTAALATDAPQPEENRTPCDVLNITTLERLNPWPVICHYELGRRLFQGLHDANPADFAVRTKQLYRRNREHAPLNADDIRNAFDHADYWPTLRRYLPPAKPPTE